MQIEDRIIQVVGHFYKYDTHLDKNMLIKESLFLCVDKVLTEDGLSQYWLMVVDGTQETCFCHKQICTESSI